MIYVRCSEKWAWTDMADLFMYGSCKTKRGDTGRTQKCEHIPAMGTASRGQGGRGPKPEGCLLFSHVSHPQL